MSDAAYCVDVGAKRENRGVEMVTRSGREGELRFVSGYRVDLDGPSSEREKLHTIERIDRKMRV